MTNVPGTPASPEDFGFGTQIRKSPYFDATVRWGAQGFSVYNHMYIPRDFGDPVQVRPGEVPVFWGCGVTPQAAVMHSRPSFAISHAPGHMAITDEVDSAFLVP